MAKRPDPWQPSNDPARIHQRDDASDLQVAFVPRVSMSLRIAHVHFDEQRGFSQAWRELFAIACVGAIDESKPMTPVDGSQLTHGPPAQRASAVEQHDEV